MKKTLYTYLFILSLGACTPTEVNLESLRSYIQDEENGLKKYAGSDVIKAELTYKPSDLIIAQNYKREIKAKPESIDSLKRSLDKYLYLTLRISQNGQEVENRFVSNEALFNKTLAYLNYEMSEDISMTVSGKSYPVADYFYQRMYGTTGGSVILIAFEKELIKEADDFKIAFEDRMLGLGYVDFEFERSDIENIPGLNFELIN